MKDFYDMNLRELKDLKLGEKETVIDRVRVDNREINIQIQRKEISKTMSKTDIFQERKYDSREFEIFPEFSSHEEKSEYIQKREMMDHYIPRGDCNEIG